MIHLAPSMSRVIAALSLVVGLLLVSSQGRAQTSGDEVVEKMTELNKDAVVAYQAGKFEDARKMLKQALDMAAAAGLQTHPITARTHIHFGIVVIGGFKQRDLGLKQFKKAIEIQADIGLTKALVTPELQDAFAEAKKGVEKGPDKPVAATPPEAKPPATPATPPPEAKPAKPAEPEVPGSGIIHEAVTEGRQGSAISVTVTVKDELEFEKLILAYRPDGATDFLGREMKEEAEGRYSAEIPTSATSGGAVAYYIEAEDANGSPVAARGSVDNPMVIHLGGVGAPVATEKDEDDDEDDDDEPDYKYFVGLMGGTGFGWATGEGDTNADRTIKSGVAMSSAVQIAPEFGYWYSSSLMLSAQIRYQYVTGTNDIYIPDGSDFRVYHTANYALAVFAKATWFYGEDKFHPFFSLAVGVGRIRHVVDFGLSDETLRTCGPPPARNASCVDTIGAGPFLVGPGGGLMYDLTDTASLVLQVNSVLAAPTFTFHLDTNLGVAVNF